MRSSPESGCQPPYGRISLHLNAEEDAHTLCDALINAPQWAASGRIKCLTPFSPTRKRYVFLCDTAAGPRVIKISETRSFGNKLRGWLGSSVARQEHRLQVKAEVLNVAATQTCGFIEWRHGLNLLRACQIQTVLKSDQLSLQDFFPRELQQFGTDALNAYADALARMHALPFFHADLKLFHAFVVNITRPSANSAAAYDLQWIDMGRAAFYMTPRKRIINLYQSLRFVLPECSEDMQRAFIARYCESSGWRRKISNRVYVRVRRFLNYKLRTHPNP